MEQFDQAVEDAYDVYAEQTKQADRLRWELIGKAHDQYNEAQVAANDVLRDSLQAIAAQKESEKDSLDAFESAAPVV